MISYEIQLTLCVFINISTCDSLKHKPLFSGFNFLLLMNVMYKEIFQKKNNTGEFPKI